MPRKVLITKETLEEILEKYQGGGGGTVEAEPIISIKMTNLEINGSTPTGVDTGFGLQFYCTKEKWDAMVAMAKQVDASLDITYSNFGTIFGQLDNQQRILLVSYLFYDYIDGKVLPKSTLSYDYDDGNDDKGTLVLETSYYAYLNESGQDLAVPAFRRPDDNNIVTFRIGTTANTVITVEEIDGASIGSSGGSGSNVELPTYYEMIFNLTPTAGQTTDYSIRFRLTEENLDLVINTINQGLQQMGMSITVTKDNWDTVVNQMLANPTEQLLIAFMQVLQYVLLVSTNHIFYDYDGAGTDIYIASIGFVKIGSNNDNMTPYHTTLIEITNHY